MQGVYCPGQPLNAADPVANPQLAGRRIPAHMVVERPAASLAVHLTSGDAGRRKRGPLYHHFPVISQPIRYASPRVPAMMAIEVRAVLGRCHPFLSEREVTNTPHSTAPTRIVATRLTFSQPERSMWIRPAPLAIAARMATVRRTPSPSADCTGPGSPSGETDKPGQKASTTLPESATFQRQAGPEEKMPPGRVER